MYFIEHLKRIVLLECLKIKKGFFLNNVKLYKKDYFSI